MDNFWKKKVLYASMHSNVLAWPNRDHCADIRSFKNLKFEERKQTKKSSSAFLRFLDLFFIPGLSIFLAIVKIQNNFNWPKREAPLLRNGNSFGLVIEI